MSFHSRLGLTPKASSERNHGCLEVSVPLNQNPRKRFSILDLGFKDDLDYPNKVSLPGCTLTAEMVIVFPEHEVWLSKDNDDEILFELFNVSDLKTPIALIWVMYSAGLLPDKRVLVLEQHAVIPPGTFQFRDRDGEYEAEFNVLA